MPKKLPMIDSDEALAQGQAAQGQPQSWGGVQQLAVPSGGVNMDAELGAEPVVGLAQEQQQQIAEGRIQPEPIVDGIGTDTSTKMNQPAMPQPAARTKMRRAAVWSDGRSVIEPSRVWRRTRARKWQCCGPMSR